MDEPLGEIARPDILRGARHRLPSGDLIGGVPPLPELQIDRLLILVDDIDGQPVADDDKIHRGAMRSERLHPSSLTATLVSDTPHARTRHPPRHAHRGDSIIRENIVILGVFAAGLSRPALVEDKSPDADGRQHALQEEARQCGRRGRSVYHHDDRNLVVSLRHHETAGEHHAVTLEGRVFDHERHALSRHAVKLNTVSPAIRKRELFSVRPAGLAKGADPPAASGLIQPAGLSIKRGPAQRVFLFGRYVDQRAVGQPVAPDVAIRGLLGAGESGRTKKQEDGGVRK